MRPGSRLLLLLLSALSSWACAEVCDDDVDNDLDGYTDCGDAQCSLFPACTACGDDKLEDAEACDDGNVKNGDGCSDRCELEACGNGRVDVADGEECDDGNRERGDGCNDRCLRDRCGDGVVQFGEECDDGNGRAADGCSARCHVELDVTCGNFRFDPGEECDDGNKNAGDGCGPKCKAEFCGDGVRQPRLGEQCDGEDGVVAGARCTFCKLDFCGNGQIDVGEGCDDGNQVVGDACSFCQPARCNNGIPELEEECDDGNFSPDDGCDAFCRREFCGDGVVQANELCDDDGDCVGCREVTVSRDGVTVTGLPVSLAQPVPGPVEGILVDAGFVWMSARQFGSLVRHDKGEQLTNPNFFIFGRFPIHADTDGEKPADVIACNQSVVFLVFTGLAINQFSTALPCSAAVIAADVNGDGSPSIFAHDATGIGVQRDPQNFTVEHVDIAGLGSEQALAVLRGANGDPDRVVVAAEGDAFFLDAASLTLSPADIAARLVIGADVDGDGDDELVVVNEEAGVFSSFFGARALPAGFSADRLVAGDLDGDGAEDVVAIGFRTASLLLSSGGFVALDPFPVPQQGQADIDDNELWISGGRLNVQQLVVRYRVTVR